MHFETRLLLANISFLLTYGGVKVWDCLTCRDHVREFARLFFRRLQHGNRVFQIRPAEEWALFREKLDLLENWRAFVLEAYWDGLLFFLAWLPSLEKQMTAMGPRYNPWANPFTDHQYNITTVVVLSYVVMIAFVRMMQSRCTPPQEQSH